MPLRKSASPDGRGADGGVSGFGATRGKAFTGSPFCGAPTRQRRKSVPYVPEIPCHTTLKLMTHQFGAIASALVLLASPVPGFAAEDQPNATGPTGSESVLVNGQPAKRAADIPGAITSPDVLINGQPVIVGCSKGTPILSPNVFVNGKPKILGCAE